jgi:hypothetical protein
MMRYGYIPIILFIFLISPLAGQTDSENSIESKKIPNGYRNVLLGMPLEQVKTALIAESRFDYRGEPDVSLQDLGSRYLISCKGRGFIREGFFQFNENLLYLIILEFEQEKMDFFTLQQRLISQYGPPSDLSPEGMTWESEKTILSLEYPLTLKYLDKNTFEQFIEDAQAREGFAEISREEFLRDF